VWRPDVCRPLAALGLDPLCWSSGTLATKRFYLPFSSKTNDGETYLVIRFTNALPFYSTISTLTFLTAVKPSLAPKATDSVVATDWVSVDADRDNGAILHSSARFRRREGAASSWVATTYSKAAGCFYRLQVGPRKLGQREA
jgi:hypothetical protein